MTLKITRKKDWQEFYIYCPRCKSEVIEDGPIVSLEPKEISIDEYVDEGIGNAPGTMQWVMSCVSCGYKREYTK